MPGRHRRATLALLVALLTLAALPYVAAAPAEAVVALTGAPVGRVEVAPGGIVHFRAEVGDHDIIGDSGTWATGRIEEGETVSLGFASPGDYPFRCVLHPEETGVIAVVAEEPPPPPPNQAPTVTIVAPAEGAAVTGAVKVRARAQDPDNGPQPVEVGARVDGGDWMRMEPNGEGVFTWTWDASAAEPGQHLIEVAAFDGAVYSATASVRVNVERQPPTPTTPTPTPPPPGGNARPIVTVDAPADGAVLQPADVVVIGSAHDPDAKKDSTLHVEVLVDDGEWTRARGAADWVYVWRASEAAAGEHVIRVRAFDGTDYSEEIVLHVTVEGEDGFEPPTPTPPTAPSGNAWADAALSFGWVVVAALVVAGAWTWASSRP